jgi:hypothetical protein
MNKTINDTIKKAGMPMATAFALIATGCSSAWSQADEAMAQLITGIIGFASSALGIIFVWVLANLKGWLEAWKKKKDGESEVAKKSGETDNKK